MELIMEKENISEAFMFQVLTSTELADPPDSGYESTTEAEPENRLEVYVSRTAAKGSTLPTQGG